MRSYSIQGFKAFKITQDGRLFTDGNGGNTRTFFVEGHTYFCDDIKDIRCCSYGYHFCRKLTDVLKYYPLLESMAYCEVEGIFEADDFDVIDDKIATRGIRIIKVLTWDEVLSQIKSENSGELEDDFCINSYMIENSSCVNRSRLIKDSCSVDSSDIITDSINIYRSKNIIEGQAISLSNNVTHSFLIDDSNNIINSERVLNSNNISFCNNIIYSNLCDSSDYIYYSKNITNSFYVRNSINIIDSSFIANCENIQHCFFCYDLKNISLRIFNKKVAFNRFSEIKNDFIELLKSLDYKINFINSSGFSKLKTVNSYTLFDFVYDTENIHLINMPQEAIEYLKSLPEFNAEIFEKITNIKWRLNNVYGKRLL